MEVSPEKGPGGFRRERQQTQNELLLLLCPRKKYQGTFIDTYNVPGTTLSDYLTESALQKYYYLHLMDEETVV